MGRFTRALLTVLGAGILFPAPSSPAEPEPAVVLDAKTLVGTDGYFRLGRSTAGRYWLVDPQGRPFLYRGVAAVNRSGLMTGEDAPPPGPYTGAVMRQYGKEPSAFRDAVLTRLRSWGFNALGAWTGDELLGAGFPYTVELALGRVGPRILAEAVALPDAFDPAWEEAAETRARALCAARREDPHLVGYFSDNQLIWGLTRPAAEDSGREVIEQGRPSLLQVCLSLPSSRAAHRAAWDLLEARHGKGLGPVSRAWGIELKSPEMLRDWTRRDRQIASPGYVEDEKAFAAELARRYFETAARVIRKHDPHHLLLGNRFGYPVHEAVLAAMDRRVVDVMSLNTYHPDSAERVDTVFRVTGLPVLVTEFSWAKAEFYAEPLPEEPEKGLSDVERRAANGRRALERLIRHPAVVGYTWYRWVDFPTTAASKSAFGLVRIDDEPKPVVVEALKSFNEQAEGLARLAPSK